MKRLKLFFLAGIFSLASVLMISSAAKASVLDARPAVDLNLEGSFYLNGEAKILRAGDDDQNAPSDPSVTRLVWKALDPSDGSRTGTAIFDMHSDGSLHGRIKLPGGAIESGKVHFNEIPIPGDPDGKIVVVEEFPCSGTGEWAGVAKCVCRCVFQMEFDPEGKLVRAVCYYSICFLLNG